MFSAGFSGAGRGGTTLSSGGTTLSSRGAEGVEKGGLIRQPLPICQKSTKVTQEQPKVSEIAVDQDIKRSLVRAHITAVVVPVN